MDLVKDVRLDIKAGTGDLAQKGQNFFSAETWQPEIFNPPYLFIDGPRPEITKSLEQITYGSEQKIKESWCLQKQVYSVQIQLRPPKLLGS